MALRDYVFTSESVSEGHPDKVCDRISDAVVDTFLAVEPEARCAVECLATTNRVVLAGEVRGPASITSERLVEVARHALRDIGYEQEGFHWARAHFAIARTRAVEEGLPLVRVANNGISGVVDPFGRVVARIDLDTVGYADVALPGAAAPTFYARAGDWIFVALLLFGLLPAALRRR